MESEFNKKIMLENISYLLEENNKKTGELESEAGVSTGYISRLAKDDKSKPGIEFIMGVAKSLKISIDILLNVNLSKITPTEKYLITFLEKLNSDTLADKLFWNKESADSFLHYDADINGNVDHPLLSYEHFYEDHGGDYPDEVQRVVFVSNSFGATTYICGDCFNLRLKNGFLIYVMNLSQSSHRVGDLNAFAKEIWILNPNGIKNYICSTKDKSHLAVMTETLYTSLEERVKHPKLKKDVQKAIDSFMKDDFDDDMPVLPEPEILF